VPRAGQEQVFSIWAKSPDGVVQVIATVNKQWEFHAYASFELELVEGTDQEGRWMGSWVPVGEACWGSHYDLRFDLVDAGGRSSSWEIAWVPGLKPNPETDPVVEPEYDIPSDFPSKKAGTSHTMGPDTKWFTGETIADPYVVELGQKQTFAARIRNEAGIKSMEFIFWSNTEKHLVNMRLVEGTDRDGLWAGCWMTRDLPLRYMAWEHYSSEEGFLCSGWESHSPSAGSTQAFSSYWGVLQAVDRDGDVSTLPCGGPVLISPLHPFESIDIRICYPQDGSQLPSQEAFVEWETKTVSSPSITSDSTYAPFYLPNGDKYAGEYRYDRVFEVFVDGVMREETAETAVLLNDLSEGEHTVRITPYWRLKLLAVSCDDLRVEALPTLDQSPREVTFRVMVANPEVTPSSQPSGQGIRGGWIIIGLGAIAVLGIAIVVWRRMAHRV